MCSTKIAQEELTIELQAEDQAFDGISTDVAASDKTYSMIDEIIEKFNLRYADAEVIIKDIMICGHRKQDQPPSSPAQRPGATCR